MILQLSSNSDIATDSVTGALEHPDWRLHTVPATLVREDDVRVGNTLRSVIVDRLRREDIRGPGR